MAIKFQSTLPRGERHYLEKLKSGTLQISIHAPARGATYDHFLQFHFCNNFNPRSREGSDISQYMIPRRCADFNPRSREGSDHTLIFLQRFRSISIHAPARGATI